MDRLVITLVSGGLDSLLATRLMQLQGLEVHAVHLVSPWECDERAIENAERQLGQPVRRIEKGSQYIGLVRNPAHGYGRNMNPCIDCRVFMFHRMGPLLREMDAAALVTGEVVGQRPMSQMLPQIRHIEKESGLAGMILRPLSAKLLPPTQAEVQGIVDRERLYDFHGRTRTPQMALAARLGISEYSTPGGGCKLTTAGFTPKLEDFLGHYADEDMSDARLLNYGRHFRLNDRVKIIVGRDRDENRVLEGHVAGAMEGSTGYTAYVPESFVGPTALACGPVSDEVDEFAGRTVLGYARAQEMPPGGHTIRVLNRKGERFVLVTEPFSPDEIARLRIGPQELRVVA